MIDISFTTQSPLCQIDKSESATKTSNSIIKVKRQKVFVKNKSGVNVPLQVPIYTGNGFRGMLRRETMAVMLEAVAKNSKKNNGILATPEDFHLMNAGGGNLYQTQSFEVEDEVRRLNPQLSLFGASLAIKGKLRVSNFVPLVEEEDGELHYQFYENEKGYVYSSILADATIIVKDGILDREKNSQYLTKEQIEEWLEKSDTNIKARAKDRENDNKGTKVKKETIKGIVDREYVAIGVDFFGGISAKEELTGIEKGLLIKGLERAVLNNLGSTSSNDFGKVAYSITIDSNSVLETEVDKYGKCFISDRKYSEDMLSSIKEVEKFLEDVDENNLSIAKLLS